MAKTSKPAGAENDEPGSPAQPHDVLGDFAADLGKFLGGVQTRATSWLQQRKDIADQLTQIRDTANQYLQQLGTEGSHLVERFEKARRGRPPGSGAKSGRACRIGGGPGAGRGDRQTDDVTRSAGENRGSAEEALGQAPAEVEQGVAY